MKTALIMGITGSFGGQVAQALARQGWAIRALMRNPDRLPARFRGAEVISGDASSIENVRKAAAGADIIVYGVNPPKYKWDGVVLPMIDTTAAVAEENHQTIVFPGNVYVFDPDDGPEFDERSPMRPLGSRGRLRMEMEQRLKLASERGARVIIIRMGDFIAADAASSWMRHLIRKTKSGYILSVTGPRNLIHSWAYLPDAARVTAELIDRRDELDAFSVFHYRGYRNTLNDIAVAIRQVTGKDVKIAAFPWFIIRLMAPFSTMFKSLVEMRYLWTREINLSDEKMRSVLGKPLPHTSLEDALTESGLLI